MKQTAMSKALTLLQYPDYINRQLLEISNIDWKIDEYEKLKRAYNSKIGAICSRSIGLEKGSILYRARFIEKQGMFSVSDLNENDLFDNVAQLGINSKERTKTFGRAHRPGNPVLYTSLRAETAIHEMAQWARNQYKLDSLIHRLRWQSSENETVEDDKETTNVSNVQYDADSAIFSEFYQENTLKNLVVSAWELQDDLVFTYFFVKEPGFLPDIIKSHIEETEILNSAWDTPERKNVSKSLALIEEFFSYEFVKTDIQSDKDYMLSALATDLACSYLRDIKPGTEKYAKPDGILYASVAEGHQGVNCVITAEAVAAGKIKFVSAECHSVMRPEYDAFGEEDEEKRFHAVLARAELVSEETGDLIWKLFRG